MSVAENTTTTFKEELVRALTDLLKLAEKDQIVTLAFTAIPKAGGTIVGFHCEADKPNAHADVLMGIGSLELLKHDLTIYYMERTMSKEVPSAG